MSIVYSITTTMVTLVAHITFYAVCVLLFFLVVKDHLVCILGYVKVVFVTCVRIHWVLQNVRCNNLDSNVTRHNLSSLWNTVSALSYTSGKDILKEETSFSNLLQKIAMENLIGRVCVVIL
jgi:hypothetical protein